MGLNILDNSSWGRVAAGANPATRPHSLTNTAFCRDGVMSASLRHKPRRRLFPSSFPSLSASNKRLRRVVWSRKKNAACRGSASPYLSNTTLFTFFDVACQTGVFRIGMHVAFPEMPVRRAFSGL